MQGRELFRAVQSHLVVVAVIATAAALIFAIYFTRTSLQWIAFLMGILVAAVLAEAVRSSRAEWLVMRRSAQLSSLKDKLEHEIFLRKNAEKKIASEKPRLRLIDDVFLTMVALIDTEGYCRYHNRAFRDWLNMRPELIDGRNFREILSPKTYAEIATAVRQSLDGQNVHYERMQQMPNGGMYHLSVRHIAQFDQAGKVTGFYFLADDITARGDLLHSNEHASGTDSTKKSVVSVPVHEEPSNQEMFIDSFSEQITGQKNAGKQIITAIQKGEFRLYCQLISPLVDSGEAEHYEILIRLMEEEEGMLPPGAFFPLSEKQGLMPYLDRWVVQHILEWASDQNQQHHRNIASMFFINLAAATIGDPEFPEFIKTTLEEYGMPGLILCFEVPYFELAARGPSAAEFIRRVRQCGCRVALSGFGRGTVSFDLIRGFQVEFLKIDGSIILNMLRDPVDMAKVVSINRVAKKIGVKTVAELVESEEIITKLREIEVDFAQGFGISRPSSLEE